MFTPHLGAGNALAVDGEALRLGVDYLPYYLSPSGSAQGPLAFAGYGVSLPELDKTVVLVDGWLEKNRKKA